jgi:hypothetical protein
MMKMRIPQNSFQCSKLSCENCGRAHYQSYEDSLCLHGGKLAEYYGGKRWIETPESSNIAKFRLDGSTLSVVFKAGTQYLYYDVPEAIYDGMRTAESKGKFFNANVKGQFTSEKVE